MPEHTPAPTPARSLYGFFMYLFSKTILAIYCIWAFVPDRYLHYFNIYYYPLKYWATTVPILCLVALSLFTFLLYPSLNLMLVPDIDSINTIKDSFSQSTKDSFCSTSKVSKSCICTDETQCMKDNYCATAKDVGENTVSPLRDVNIRSVCRKLYMNKEI